MEGGGVTLPLMSIKQAKLKNRNSLAGELIQVKILSLVNSLAESKAAPSILDSTGTSNTVLRQTGMEYWLLGRWGRLERVERECRVTDSTQSL